MVPLTQTARKNLVPLVFGTWASAAALAYSNRAGAILVLLPLVAVILCWTLLRPQRWLIAFFISLLLLPPLPGPIGNSGIHVAPLFAGFGILTGLLFIDEWRDWMHPLSIACLVFLAVLVESVALAALYSGWEVALGSLLRVLLFAIGVYVFLHTFAGPGGTLAGFLGITRLLFWTALAAALFACVDFYLQLPALAGFGEQYVWLDEGVFRRAQGLFYEASTLGNFCAFFLVMVLVSIFRPRDQSPFSRPTLLLGGIVLSVTLILSYSRASLLNLLVAAWVLSLVRLGGRRRSIVLFCGALILAAIGVQLWAPSFSESYWTRIAGSFQYFWSSPDGVLSGRLTHWQVVFHFLAREPWHAVFGVGYKTLPYSNYIGTTVIADNTYLSLLAETGVVGLAAFIALNAAILRTGWRALRSPRPGAAFFGEWIFCFWCGEMVQMLSGDLITYWRVLPLYFWLLGAAARETGEST